MPECWQEVWIIVNKIYTGLVVTMHVFRWNDVPVNLMKDRSHAYP